MTADELRALWQQIGIPRPPVSHRDAGGYEELRALTEEEWNSVVRAVRAGFPATIVSARFGFSFGLIVYEPAPVAVYPGTESEFKPAPVFFMTAWQFPGNDPRQHFGDQALSPRAEDEGVWERFDALCNTEENLAALAREGLPAPGSRGSYVY